MSRTVVNVATGPFTTGQIRLKNMLTSAGEHLASWTNELPHGCPPHQERPYAFKGYAMELAASAGFSTLLWADACIVPARSLEPLWQRIERDGYWISANGFSNAEWTVEEAYPYLGVTREENEGIEHVVATTFGVSLLHPIGRHLLDEYVALSKTKAFCGPVRLREGTRVSRGDMEISGHRHDQTGLSVIAHRLGCRLTSAPDVFAYRGGETKDTLLIADGAYL